MKLLRAIFPPVHKHPKKLPHEWSPLTSQQLDPFRPLEPGEDGCSEVIPMKLILDYERHGYVKLEMN